ncbi:DUF309 domain-containing protein [Paenibacillus sp. IB182496]|uniref:DUF309 domain-containing protein n=1 Tax=Paenibacillus sabuli TaxID=2772509 RepID=A0A927GTT6_9BACL|nr:DUF309 domain-containing protein [Paenibacillus sabuli]MBD2847636.1 DUF309 domain-containing protein [Paenibacillus sabuli]
MKHYPEAYVRYLIEFHATRDYFECHELLEEHWKEEGPAAPLARTWVALIQLAVGQYHHRRGNASGALKMLRQALRGFDQEALAGLGLDGGRLQEMVRGRARELEGGGRSCPFRDLNLPLADPDLVARCLARGDEIRASWGLPSRIDDVALVHRHTLRDRTDVIAAREAALARRRSGQDDRPGAIRN